jgi:hypothetical protein
MSGLIPLLTLLAGDARAEAPARQRVILQASFVELVPGEVHAQVQQDGALRELRLVDDGSDPEDAAGDRVWTGSLEGDPAQFLPIVLTVADSSGVRDVWTGTVHAGLAGTVAVAFEVTKDPSGRLSARRRATAAPGALAHATEALPWLASTGWGLLLLAFAATALRERASGAREDTDRREPLG